VFAYDPLRLVVDVRGVAASGYELEPLLRNIDDINLELYAQNMIVAVFGMGERDLDEASRLVLALRLATERVGLKRGGTLESFAAPPAWGELVMTPRDAYLAAQEVVAAEQAVGRISAETLAIYPPGIPNVLPGERLSGQTLSYVRETLALGGSVHGASDRMMRTVRVVAERRPEPDER
jgi:arginine decarboxylase